MSQFQVLMPKLGESITEATITKWFVKEGDTVEEDDVLLEIATDKVDSEIPSPVAGKIVQVLYKENDVVPVGQVIAVIALEGEEGVADTAPISAGEVKGKEEPAATIQETKPKESEEQLSPDRFYSPLVKTIAKQENISAQELNKIHGTGQNGRVTKDDILDYLESRKKPQPQAAQAQVSEAPKAAQPPEQAPQKPKVQITAGPQDEIIEMDRMRRAISDHMIMSKQTSAHVTASRGRPPPARPCPSVAAASISFRVRHGAAPPNSRPAVR
jgi:2-oxoglutarate dehydrogenase E2 component (dihydrolipoamide succinyltransferase)